MVGCLRARQRSAHAVTRSQSHGTAVRGVCQPPTPNYRGTWNTVHLPSFLCGKPWINWNATQLFSQRGRKTLDKELTDASAIAIVRMLWVSG